MSTSRIRRISFDIDEAEAPKWEKWLRESNFDFISFLLDPKSQDLTVLEDCGISVVRNSAIKIPIDFGHLNVGEFIVMFRLRGKASEDRRCKNVRSRVTRANKVFAPKKFASRTINNDHGIMRIR